MNEETEKRLRKYIELGGELYYGRVSVFPICILDIEDFTVKEFKEVHAAVYQELKMVVSLKKKKHKKEK